MFVDVHEIVPCGFTYAPAPFHTNVQPFVIPCAVAEPVQFVATSAASVASSITMRTMPRPLPVESVVAPPAFVMDAEVCSSARLDDMACWT